MQARRVAPTGAISIRDAADKSYCFICARQRPSSSSPLHPTFAQQSAPSRRAYDDARPYYIRLALLGARHSPACQLAGPPNARRRLVVVAQPPAQWVSPDYGLAVFTLPPVVLCAGGVQVSGIGGQSSTDAAGATAGSSATLTEPRHPGELDATARVQGANHCDRWIRWDPGRPRPLAQVAHSLGAEYGRAEL